VKRLISGGVDGRPSRSARNSGYNLGYVDIGKTTRKPSVVTRSDADAIRPSRMLYVHVFISCSVGCCTGLSPSRLPCSSLSTLRPCLVLLVARVAQTRVLALEDDGSSVDPVECLGGNGRALGSDRGTNGHEEAGGACQRMLQSPRIRAYPKVAAEPIMYCPSVRSIPFGPGPKRTMLVNPGRVRETLRESRLKMRTEDEADDQADSC
jgi:hypothetical protein